MHGVRPPHGLRVDLGEAQVPHVPGLDQFLDRADGLLDRHAGVAPGGPVDVALITPDQGQELLVLTPADDETRERMDLLRVPGSEEFPAGAAGSDGR